MTAAERLRALAGVMDAKNKCACEAGADALDRAAQTCANCDFIDTTYAIEGTGLCQSTGGDGVGGWVPLHARCDCWTAKEPTA